MKKIFNVKNIGLLLIVVLITVLTTSTKEAKAAGTVTWSGPSSITIRETIRNITNPIVASREYGLWNDSAQQHVGPTATINYTSSDTPTNYQITKTAVMNLSNLTFTKPGDYEYYLFPSSLDNPDGIGIDNYFLVVEEQPDYVVIVQVRNVVDSNNIPTGNFTASLLVKECTYNEQSDEDECTKVNPLSGNLIADYGFETNTESFGHIEVSKTVKGIGADTTKYFPFTISINSDTSENNPLNSSEWSYSISGLDTTVTYNGSTINNPTTIADGTPTTIYLKHGQTAIIGQVTSGGNTFDAIPVGVSCLPFDKTCVDTHNTFTIEETPGDYSPSFSIDNGSFVTGYSVPATDINNGVNAVDFINTKEMSPVTGLIFTIFPYMILLGIGVGGTLLVIRLKKEERKVKE